MDVDIRRMFAAEDGVHDIAEPSDLDAFLSGGLGVLRDICEPLRAGAVEANFLANGRSVDAGRPRAQKTARKKRAYYNRSDNRANRNTQQ